MSKVVISGGGWSGCAAAIAAAKLGCEVELFERADMLLGTGLVGGIMRNNGRYTATEEMIAMGGGDLFKIADSCARHVNIEFPGHKHANLYDVARIEPAVRSYLLKMGISIHMKYRVDDISCENGVMNSISAQDSHDNNQRLTAIGDAFVDASGTAGPMGNCAKYGNGCAMCIYRCPTFGPRFSIAAKAGIAEVFGKKADGTFGAMSGSCKLHKDSLAPSIRQELDEKGVVVVSLPQGLRKSRESLGKKACQQYNLQAYADNIILLDTGHAKMMTPFFPLDQLRKIPGFESARYEDPYAGGIGNSMRYLGMLPRDNALKVQGLKNVFCGGEKAGLLVGHTEAIVTGTLAGHNAARTALGMKPIELPVSLACGDAIAFVRDSMQTEEGMAKKYTFSGSIFFERMKVKNLYTTDIAAIQERVKNAGMSDVFAHK